MLLSLYIKDFGIIDQTGINLTRGMNVLSGETGAGKSIIIEAIQVVTGGRALSEYVRAGCDRAIVQAAAEVGDLPEVIRILNDSGIAPEHDGMIILTREINRSGRNLCRINGQMAPLSLYREIGRTLVDIQGQYGQQMLFEPERQLFLLDAYGGEEILRTAADVTRLFRSCREVGDAINSLREKYMEWSRRQDTINYQIADIDGAGIRPGEDEELESQKKKLANAEKISAMVGDCYRQLYGGAGTAASSLELAGNSLKLLDRLVEMDQGLSQVRDNVAEALYRLEEASRELAAYADGLEFYPSRLEVVEERLDILARLKKKYGRTIGDILRYRDDISAELAEMGGGEQKIELLERELGTLTAQLEEQAKRLTELRKKAAASLEAEITRELKELEMPGAVFSIVFTDRNQISERGMEKAEFYISTNPGEPVRPLSKVASGGEASRLMLAIKSILAEMDEIPTLVFDEIDTGIGGRTIRSVAVKLHLLGRKRQVICVTHSPAVASMALNHLLIRKSEEGGRTRAEVISLDSRGRMEELSRMLGGGRNEELSLTHARQLMEEAMSVKDS